MCGICGQIANTKTDPEPIRKMNKALVHRGPDGEGEYIDMGIVLAMRRLSIIDLESSWQPLFNENKSMALIINGEIYNYLELRNILKAKGHKFRTSGDGEVILHLYEDFGPECLSHLRGMFAFALWDGNKHQLFLARDRMGEKPLYYYKTGNSLLFSSELRSLLASGIVNTELDPSAVNRYFHYHYIPEPQTPFLGINKLPAGNYLIINQNDLSLKQCSYWDIDSIPPLTGVPAVLIREKLEEISSLIIRSDVPVGIALSGGMDSSVIAALASSNYSGDLHAFTVGYEGYPHNDERKAAQQLTEDLNLPFHEIELSNSDFVNSFSLLVSKMDDPIADISAFGYYSLSKAAKEAGVPVLIQGQGGDELFWGYPWVKKALGKAYLKKSFRKQGLFSLPAYLMPRLPLKNNYSTWKKWAKDLAGVKTGMKTFFQHRSEPSGIFPFYNEFPGFRDIMKERNKYYGPFLQEYGHDYSASEIFEFNDDWDRPDLIINKLIIQTYLLEHGIVQGDRLSMANSVEMRLPLVDHKFVETVIGIRKTSPDHSLEPKLWFKEATRDLVPEYVFQRKKRGFEPPVREWHEALKQQYSDKLRTGQLRGKQILNGKENLSGSSLFFRSLVLELWLESLNIR